MSLTPIRQPLFILGLLLSLAPGCGGEESEGCPEGQVDCDGVCMEAIAPTAAALQAKVFNLHCSACHSYGYSLDNEGLMLDSLTDLAALIDKASAQMPEVKLVAAGDAANSYLVHKMRGENIKPGKEIMPPASWPALCEPKIKAVENWINQGAP